MSVRAQAIANRDAEIDASTQRAIAAREAAPPRRMSAIESMSVRLGVNEKELTAALTSTVFKECKSQAQFLALIVVANEYRLNPLTKEIYAFPVKGGAGVVPMVSVDGWITLMNSHPDFDGIEFEYHEDERGHLLAVESIIYHKQRSRPIKTIEFMDECKGNTGPWQKSPRRMLRHRALIQGARIAFGFSGVYSQGDEDNGVIEGDFSYVASGPAVLPGNDDFASGHDEGESEHDPDTGEVARDPQTGMTEVDEETARELDAGQADPEPEGEEIATADAPAAEEQPVWKVHFIAVRGMIERAKDQKTWEKAETEFLKISGGLPDAERDELDRKLIAKRNALQGGGN